LEFAGDGYLELPKWLLDQRNYTLDFLFNWQGTNTQTLFNAQTQNQEKLTLELIPIENGQFEISLKVQDRDGQNINKLLQHTMLKTSEWLKLSLIYNDENRTLTLQTTPQVGGDSAHVVATVHYGTREFQYTTLRILLGSDINSGQNFTGRIDELKLVR